MTLKILLAAATLAVLPGSAFAIEGDAKAGSMVFKKCMACHSATEPKNKVGPHLVGIVGKPVASVEGYKYSPAMTAFAAGGKVWDEATLSAYLAAPKAVVPGGKMAFAGLKKPEDLANIIAYLKDPASAK